MLESTSDHFVRDTESSNVVLCLHHGLIYTVGYGWLLPNHPSTSSQLYCLISLVQGKFGVRGLGRGQGNDSRSSQPKTLYRQVQTICRRIECFERFGEGNAALIFHAARIPKRFRISSLPRVERKVDSDQAIPGDVVLYSSRPHIERSARPDPRSLLKLTSFYEV